ncbi:MAG: carbamoyltransferase HypF [Anaerolineales bacterium]|jgi:hydrogenase maturation protein HypF
MSDLAGASIHITGIVQGVGFRPFVYGLATRLALTGWVRNTSAGVDISVDGTRDSLECFLRALRDETPPLARIDEFQVIQKQPNGFSSFEIVHSQAIPEAFQPISPDVSICPDCLRELFDPNDRRYRYPFINCTNCGPRFTIIQDIPYDRPKTTMAPFEMCPACAAEYHNPLDRRFHAQPVACPDCGPQVWLETDGSPEQKTENAILETRLLLAQGKIVAVKGLGGFHLACDATNLEAVSELRHRKLRVDKPFALMLPDLETVEKHCALKDTERELLLSRERPIVILEKRPNSPIVAEVAPGQSTLGVMLPYTPLHYLLLERQPGYPEALVMTSGNLSEEPIATDNSEARERLASLADAFLMHNREIHTRCDDSVMRVLNPSQISSNRHHTSMYPLRRARGYAPFPIRLPWKLTSILATGAELKNTFCLTRDHYAFLSHHIGDLENYETLRSFEEGVVHFERLFRVKPEAIAYDLHPNYLSTRYGLTRAEREGLPAVGVQHHHAHIAACMAENGFEGNKPVIGVAFDGTGYGDDGAIWGGEILLSDYAQYQRVYHLAYVPLPGGDKAIREPWRMALAWLEHAGLEWAEDLPPVRQDPLELSVLRHQLQSGLNAPPTSSMGRLFDAISALAGVRQQVNYEAQAAIELEALADPDEVGVYPLEISDEVIDPTPLIQAAVMDLRRGLPVGKIAARFHNGLAGMVLQVCQRLRAHFGVTEVVLSGGVWQNMTLLTRAEALLGRAGFAVYVHRQVPANDGGLALGQAMIADRIVKER